MDTGGLLFLLGLSLVLVRSPVSGYREIQDKAASVKNCPPRIPRVLTLWLHFEGNHTRLRHCWQNGTRQNAAEAV